VLLPTGVSKSEALTVGWQHWKALAINVKD
jgi:hypothetical protein